MQFFGTDINLNKQHSDSNVALSSAVSITWHGTVIAAPALLDVAL